MFSEKIWHYTKLQNHGKLLADVVDNIFGNICNDNCLNS